VVEKDCGSAAVERWWWSRIRYIHNGNSESRRQTDRQAGSSRRSGHAYASRQHSVKTGANGVLNDRIKPKACRLLVLRSDKPGRRSAEKPAPRRHSWLGPLRPTYMGR
jgi:hypothetical protein